MKNTLINDKRLTPTMKRVRSWKTQIFTEKGETSKISIQHDKKSMYAKLIDGLWYWVEGCAECKGEKRDWMTYIECEDHDRCRTCNIKRKDVKDIPWAGKNGWQCKPCDKKEKNYIRKRAFEEFNNSELSEFDFQYIDEIKCPHCGSKISSEEMYETQNIECHVCEGKILLEVEHSRTYSTSILGDRITE